MTTDVTLSIPVDCDNAPKKQVIRDFNIAFARGDVASVLSFLTEEVEWDIVGNKVLQRKAAVEAELNHMAETSFRSLSLDIVLTHGKFGSAVGALTTVNGDVYRFSDTYEFVRAGKHTIQRFISFAMAAR
jgi:ketosteroid isomerase-like protein